MLPITLSGKIGDISACLPISQCWASSKHSSKYTKIHLYSSMALMKDSLRLWEIIEWVWDSDCMWDGQSRALSAQNTKSMPVISVPMSTWPQDCKRPPNSLELTFYWVRISMNCSHLRWRNTAEISTELQLRAAKDPSSCILLIWIMRRLLLQPGKIWNISTLLTCQIHRANVHSTWKSSKTKKSPITPQRYQFSYLEIHHWKKRTQVNHGRLSALGLQKAIWVGS